MPDLAALLDKQASVEITAILSEARERASEIAAAAKAEAEAYTAQQERQARTQAEAAVVRARSAAQLEAASRRLTAQYGVVDQVFDAVRAELERLTTSDRWPEVMEKLLTQAVQATGQDAGQVRSIAVSPAHVEIARTLAARIAPSAEVVAAEGVKDGVRVSAGESNIVTVNTLSDRLAGAREDLAAEVSRLLGTAAGA